jgi:putative acetyltransferase
MDLIVRAERENDREAVYAVNLAAFDNASEAELAEALRAEARPVISLVAELAEKVIGHIMFSPASMAAHPDLRIMGLAPMAVLPEYQRKGVGSALIEAGLEKCRNLGMNAVIVLGHPAYYPRFGFQPSSRFNMESEYDVPAEVFMALELEPGVLSEVSGRVGYHDAFSELE